MPPADNLTVNEQLTGPHAAGVNSILPKEHGSQFFYLPVIRHSDEEVSNGFDLTHTTALLWPKSKLWETYKCKCRCSFIAVCNLTALQPLSYKFKEILCKSNIFTLFLHFALLKQFHKELLNCADLIVSQIITQKRAL